MQLRVSEYDAEFAVSRWPVRADAVDLLEESRAESQSAWQMNVACPLVTPRRFLEPIEIPSHR